MAPPDLHPQKNSRVSPVEHKRILGSRSAQRITKSKRNRGKPSKYAETCVKRLLFLRACGLANLELIDLFGGKITERTIQDFAKQYLGEPHERYGGPCKDDARKHTSFLKKLLKRSNDERTSKRRRAALKHTSVPDQVPTTAEVLQLEEPCDIEAAQLNNHEPTTLASETKRLSMTCSRVAGTLRHSMSSSFIRAIDRFSWSSLGSASTATTFRFDPTPPQHTTAKLISERMKALTDAKNKLDKICCGKHWPQSTSVDTEAAPLCLHIRVLSLIGTDTKDVDELWESFYLELHTKEYPQYPRKPMFTVHDADLFFVTRVGAPLRLIEALIGRAPNIHFLNEEGQNFLFFLNAQTFKHATCSCQWLWPYTAHTSPFVCLIQTLERYNFDFEHLDHNGRTFLSFLLAFVSDPKRWIAELMCISNIWRERIARMALQNDACGLLLADFINQETWSWHIFQTSQGPTSLPFPLISRQNSTKDVNLRTQLQQYIRTGFLRTEADSPLPFGSTEIGASINHYSADGRTPVMEFLVAAMESNMASSVICNKLDILVRNGANINLRSSGGQTVLHLAAGRARAKVIEYLLVICPQRDHCDDAGRTAYDYAWNLFNKSRKRDVKVLQATRAFQALIVLDEDRKRGSARSNVHQRSGDICRMLNV